MFYVLRPVWKLTKGNHNRMYLGGWQGEHPCPTSCGQLHIQQEETNLAHGYHFTMLPEQEKLTSSCWQQPSQWESHNSANEKPLHFQLPVYSNGLSAYISCSQGPLSYLKEPPGLVLRTCPRFCCCLPIPGCNSLLFQTKPIFCWQNSWKLYV